VVKVSGWVLVNLDFTVPVETNYVRIFVECNSASSIAYIDDFRVHPIDASMKSYVYDIATERLSAELDNENFATFYEYYDNGKIKKISRETIDYGIKTVAEYEYNYAREGE
jgi:hypothetical protein